MKRKALKAAFPYTLPICVGFLFLGLSYGFLMRSQGFFVRVSPADEHFYFCRLDGIRDGRAAFVCF